MDSRQPEPCSVGATAGSGGSLWIANSTRRSFQLGSPGVGDFSPPPMTCKRDGSMPDSSRAISTEVQRRLARRRFAAAFPTGSARPLMSSLISGELASFSARVAIFSLSVSRMRVLPLEKKIWVSLMSCSNSEVSEVSARIGSAGRTVMGLGSGSGSGSGMAVVASTAASVGLVGCGAGIFATSATAVSAAGGGSGSGSNLLASA